MLLFTCLLVYEHHRSAECIMGYGNTGYGVSSPGIQNHKGFVPKNQHTRNELLNFENLCNMEHYLLLTYFDSINS